MKLQIEKIFVIYIVLCVIACNLLPIPELIKGFLAMFSFLIVPYLIGNIILTSRFVRDIIKISDLISYFVLSWSLGLVVTVLSIVFLYAAHLLEIKSFSFFVIAFLLSYYFYFLIFKSKSLKARYPEISFPKEKISSIGIVLVIIGIYVLFMFYFNPFPLWTDYDIYNLHNPLSNNLINFNELSVTPSYIDSISILTAVLCILFNVGTYTFSWVCGHFLFPIVAAFGAYFFFVAFVDKKHHPFIIFMVFLYVWLLFVADTDRLTYKPNTLVYLLIPWIFFFIKKNIVPFLTDKKLKYTSSFFMLLGVTFSFIILYFFIKKTLYIGPNSFIYITLYCILLYTILLYLSATRRSIFSTFFLLFVISSVLFLNHADMGLSTLVMIMTYLLIVVIMVKNPKNTKKFTLFFGIMLLFIIFLGYHNYINLPEVFFNPPSGAEAWRYMDTVKSVDFFFSYFPYDLIFLLVLIGGYGIIKHSAISRSAIAIIVVFLVCNVFFFFMNTLEISRVIKGAYLFGLILVLYGISELFELLKFENKQITKIIKLFVVLFIVVISVNIVIEKNVFEINKWIDATGKFSMILPYEYSSGVWMKNNVAENTLILSDPQTMVIISSISNERAVPSLTYNSKIQNDLFDALNSSTSIKAYSNIHKLLKDENMTKRYAIYASDSKASQEWAKRQQNVSSAVVVIEGRTCYWIKTKRKNKFSKPQEFYPMTECEGILDIFFNDTYFTLLHNESDQMYLFGIRDLPKSNE